MVKTSDNVWTKFGSNSGYSGIVRANRQRYYTVAGVQSMHGLHALLHSAYWSQLMWNPSTKSSFLRQFRKWISQCIAKLPNWVSKNIKKGLNWILAAQGLVHSGENLSNSPICHKIKHLLKLR